MTRDLIFNNHNKLIIKFFIHMALLFIGFYSEYSSWLLLRLLVPPNNYALFCFSAGAEKLLFEFNSLDLDSLSTSTH